MVVGGKKDAFEQGYLECLPGGFAEAGNQTRNLRPTSSVQSSTYTMSTGDAEQGAQLPSERRPLLGAQVRSDNDLVGIPSKPEGKITAIIWTVLAGVFALGLIVVFAFPAEDWDDLFPSPEKILESAPVIDGHIGRFIPHVCDPQHLGSLPVYLPLRDQTCPSLSGWAMRITCLPLISMDQCLGTSTYHD